MIELLVFILVGVRASLDKRQQKTLPRSLPAGFSVQLSLLGKRKKITQH